MVLKEKKEEELIASAQNGNEEAMAVLLERYKSLVRALSRPLFLMDGDQDDLLQEGMIGLYKAIQTFQDQKMHLLKPLQHFVLKDSYIVRSKRPTGKKIFH